jgi:tripartite-type tricarboxylate transporter receptor subunit TctC
MIALRAMAGRSWRPVARAHSDKVDLYFRKCALASLRLSHFLRKTGVHFSGKCSGAGFVAVVLALVATSAAAETYPARPVTIVTPFAAGSQTDAAARLVGQYLQDALGQSFVIENKAGAGGLIAANAVARAKPDGYTLLLTTNSTHSAVALFKSVPYDPIKDFAPIARIGNFPSFVAVNSSLPIASMAELVAEAKANPGKLSYGVGNSSGYLVGETLKKRTGIDVVRVAYRSNPFAMADLVAGHIQIMVPDMTTGLPQVKALKIRALAVLTKERNPLLPDVPTLHETVMPDFETLAWAGMFAPANTPPEIVNALAGALRKMLENPESRERFAGPGIQVVWTGPQEFSEFVKSELVKWTAMIREAGIEPE